MSETSPPIVQPLTGFWIKSHTAALEDVTIATLPDNLWRRFHELKHLVEHDAESGVLPIVKAIAFRLRIPEIQLLEELRELVSLGLLIEQGISFELPNFVEEQTADSTAERKARQRERDRMSRACHEPVTFRDTERKKDKTEQIEQITQSDPDGIEECEEDAFGKFWEVYPKKVDRLKALQAWVESEGKRPPLAVVLAAVDSYAKECQSKEPRFIAAPASWLSNERWSDEGVKVPTAPAASSTQTSSTKVDSDHFRSWMIEQEYVDSVINTPFKDCPENIQKLYLSTIVTP